MDNSLFKKHLKIFNERDKDKNTIIEHIKNKTKIVLNENEIKIEKKKVSLNISSIKKAELYKHKLEERLEEIGFYYK